MGVSVTGIMQMNMFGIPVIGADVCGFNEDTTPELCARWTKLATFYPFARNHNSIGMKDQEPYRPMFDKKYIGNVTYSDIIKDSIMQRYDLIPYLYSHIIDMSHNGGTYFKPLFHRYPTDPKASLDIKYNWLLGDDIKVGMVTD